MRMEEEEEDAEEEEEDSREKGSRGGRVVEIREMMREEVEEEIEREDAAEERTEFGSAMMFLKSLLCRLTSKPSLSR